MNKDKLDKFIKAIDIFNEKHRKYKVNYRTVGNDILFNIKENKFDFTEINVYLNINNLDTIDEIIEVLEDLRKDLSKI